MIRLLWRSDVHLSDHAPSSRKDDWASTVFSKLDQVRLVAEKLQVAGVLDGGDFFHTKSPSRNTHRLVRMAADHHASYPCPVFCTPGNHDSVYGDYSFLDQQPLGVLFASGVFQRLYDEHEVYFGPADATSSLVKAYPVNQKDGIWLRGNPFSLERTDFPIVRVVGIPYHGTKYDIERVQRIKKGSEDFLVCVAHVLASPRGGSFFEAEDIWSYEDLSVYAPDVFLFGHWHKDQGDCKVRNKLFINIGSLTRGSIVQDEVERKPSIALLTFEKGKPIQYKIARLKVKPPEEVFDLDARVRSEARTMTMDAFIQSVRATLVDSANGSLEDAVGKSALSEKVKERALLYLEKV